MDKPDTPLLNATQEALLDRLVDLVRAAGPCRVRKPTSISSTPAAS
ncbi:MAG: hypothetical protein U1E15_11465 [Hyphomicrobiales bacterium]